MSIESDLLTQVLLPEAERADLANQRLRSLEFDKPDPDRAAA